MLRKIISALVIIILILAAVSIILFMIPPASINSKDVVAEISAGDLYQAFSNDEKKAQKTYLGKAVIVYGIIEDKYKDETGAPVLILKTDEGISAALVTLEKGQETTLIDYDIGDKIRVKAQCSGLLMEVTLGKGLILE